MSRILPAVMFALLATLSVSAQAQEAGDIAALKLPDGNIRFTLFTPKGHVSFAAGADWSVTATQPHPPVTTITFQIPDSYGGRVEATVRLLQPNTTGGQEALATYDRQHAALKPETYKGWTIFTSFTYYEVRPNPTIYSVMEAHATQADEICEVRLSWPDMSARDADYDAHMKAAFKALLDSVQGGIGPYQTSPGETVRHPTE